MMNGSGSSGRRRSVDVLIEPPLRQAWVADARRTVGRRVNVVRSVRARLVDIEPVLIVACARLSWIVSGNKIARIREDGIHAAGHCRDVNVVTPERIATRAVRLPVVVAGDGAYFRLAPCGAAVG